MGNQISVDEQLRQHKRSIERAIRELDRERVRLEAEENTVKRDIKSAAGRGEINSARIMARDLIRIRRHIQKFHEMRSQLQAIKLRLQTVKSTQAMTDTMKGVSGVMVRMNNQIEIPALKNIVKNFVKESDKMELTADLVNDAVDATVGEPDVEVQEEEIMSKVLEELGVDLQKELADAPTRQLGQDKVAAANSLNVGAGIGAIDQSLEDRLKNLRQ